MIPNPNRDFKDITVYRSSSDDWYGSYIVADESGRKHTSGCSVTLCLVDYDCFITEDIWRVVVGGTANHAVKKDFCNYNEAFNCFIEVVKLEDVTLEILTDYMGFTSDC